jgi:hypothetical protein
MCKLKCQNINGFNKCFQPVCSGLRLTHLSGVDSNLSDTAKQTFSFENQRGLCLTESSIILLKNKGYTLELLLKLTRGFPNKVRFVFGYLQGLLSFKW